MELNLKGRLCHYGSGGAPSSVVCVLSVVPNLFTPASTFNFFFLSLIF